jgi:hypothetical protein
MRWLVAKEVLFRVTRGFNENRGCCQASWQDFVRSHICW